MSRLLPITAVLSLMFPLLANAQGQRGQQAPSMKFEHVLVDGVPTPLSLRDKVVVLDFWATWCSPCVAAIPKFNKLVKEFEARPVVFVSVSDESEAVVKKFLQKRPIAGFVAVDDDGSVFKQFNVKTRPFTVLIDRNGRIATFTDSYGLNKTMIDDLLR